MFANFNPTNSPSDYEIIYILNEKHVENLLNLYKNEWWSKDRTKEDVDKILKGSQITIGIIDKGKSENGLLIGFGRILTDYFKYAYIHDIMVDKNYRGKGFGALIMETIIQHPDLKTLKHIELTCVENMVPFYKKFSFLNETYGNSIPLRRTNFSSSIS